MKICFIAIASIITAALALEATPTRTRPTTTLPPIRPTDLSVPARWRMGPTIRTAATFRIIIQCLRTTNRRTMNALAMILDAPRFQFRRRARFNLHQPRLHRPNKTRSRRVRRIPVRGVSNAPRPIATSTSIHNHHRINGLSCRRCRCARRVRATLSLWSSLLRPPSRIVIGLFNRPIRR
jgi:hypothetical protein